ncbi:extracellular solute-binding protein [Actinoallomurus sp. NBC_01490]|uniref:extracellular solute-binding protein n=1 Tax=Actinoallomurus sp. NBC_01490 TaxID=2903557 RepID=UPI002E3089A5|nr:extracellular solute-binding protein [Actinoallomurus sp. NBC_01490]
MRRRDALLTLALCTLTGCGAGRDGLRVVGVWNGWELARFRDVLTAFSRRGRWKVSLLSAGNDLDALLGNQVARTAAPDVALVPKPQLVAAARRQLVPPRPAPGAPPAPAGWTRLLTFDGRIYGSWFKVAHKSLVWYRPDMLREVPSDWDEWLALCGELAAAGRPPLAIGAADGWVLTDWFENALLSIDPGTYRRLATGAALWRHPSVEAALRRIGGMWSIPGVFAGGPRRALLTQYDGALIDVFEHGSAPMVCGADFYYPIIRQNGSAPARWFRFPNRRGEHRPLLAGGDAAVLLRPASEAGRALVDWLATPEAARPWAATGGLLSLDPRVKDYPADQGLLAAELRNETADGVTFDLSDQLGGRLAGNDGRGTWRIFQEFFAAVAERPSALDAAVSRAVARLDGTSRGTA